MYLMYIHFTYFIHLKMNLEQKFEMNSEQKKSVEEIFDFFKKKNINNECGYHLLKGSAGTGKTFAVGNILEKLSNEFEDFNGNLSECEEDLGWDTDEDEYDYNDDYDIGDEPYEETIRENNKFVEIKNTKNDKKEIITFLAPTHKALKVLTKSIKNNLDPIVYKYFKLSFKTISKFLLKKKVEDVVDGKVVKKFLSSGVDEKNNEIIRSYSRSIDQVADYFDKLEQEIFKLENNGYDCIDEIEKKKEFFEKEKNLYENMLYDENVQRYYTTKFCRNIQANGIVIVDECSMIGKNDFNVMKKVGELFKLKFLFLGDPAQFGPIVITDKKKRKLTSILSKTFKIKNRSVLTKTVRADSEQLYNIYSIFRKIVYHPSINYKKHIYQYLNQKNDYFNVFDSQFDFLSEIKNSLELKENFCVLSHTNKSVSSYNDKIKRLIHPDSESEWFLNDRIIFTQPYKPTRPICNGILCKHYPCSYINNNDTGYIIDVEEKWYYDKEDYFFLGYTEKKRLKKKSIKIFKLRVKIENFECPVKGSEVLIDVYKVCKNDREKYLRGLRRRKQIIIDQFTERENEKNPFSKSEKKIIFDKLNEKKNEIDCPIKRSYAITTMKSQGSTYDKIFIDARDLDYCQMVPGDKARNLYTAVTRAKTKIYLFLKFSEEDKKCEKLNDDFLKKCSRCHNLKKIINFVRPSGSSRKTCNSCSRSQRRCRLKKLDKN